MERGEELRRAVAGEPLPLALIDLMALEANLATVLAPVRARGKTLRLATKSIRSVPLLRLLLERGQGAVRGLMTYAASETHWLAAQGFDDLLLAYPTASARDAALLAEVNRTACAAVVADAPEHLHLLSAAARAAGTRIPVVVEVDLAFRALGLHLGVRRSPLRSIDDVVSLCAAADRDPNLGFHGLLGYEAQIAGLGDRPSTRALKRLSRPDVAARRAKLVAACAKAGLTPRLFNGGGTGSLASSAAEDAVTEVAAGSGFLCGHLFDSYDGLPLVPAAFFALQVVRRPAPGLVACHGGGYVASGEAGPSRLPIPAHPPGLRLLALEGAGEVQTPLRVPRNIELRLGDAVLFRHAKAGELAEHFDEYLLIRDGRIEGRARTYRGEGRSFLG